MPQFNWDPCVTHRGNDVDTFLEDYFTSPDRNTLLIAGAGFDPRSTMLCKRLASITSKLHALYIQEIRPSPEEKLVRLAAENINILSRLTPNHNIIPFEVFGSDNAVVGGRNIVQKIHRESFGGYSDVLVDISAMSVGTSFPLIRYLIDRTMHSSGSRNLHLFVMSNAMLDESIVPIAGDTVGFVHGFRGGWALDENTSAAKLWLPQLALGRRSTLQHVYDFVAPQDTCPILPFPSAQPRLGDDLAEHYLPELESSWDVDPRNIIYAAEDDPLDLYRTILRIDDLRNPIFKEFGGSLLVLSPTGSKVLALGTLMAALERDFPIVYLESIGYNFIDAAAMSHRVPENVELIHIWLEGDAYPSPRQSNMKNSIK
jgi:hypothetical protein